MSDEPETAIPPAELVELHADQNGLDVRMKHPIIPLVAMHLAAAFKDVGGENYVTFEINTDDLGPLMLTMQRRLGETPAAKAARLEAELTRLTAPATDEGIVEIGRRAEAASLNDGCPDAGGNYCGPEVDDAFCMCRRNARAVLAVAGPMIAARERERLALMVECQDTPRAERFFNSDYREGWIEGIRDSAAAIRNGGTDGQ